MIRRLFFFLLLFLSYSASAQDTGSTRGKKILPRDTVTLDTLSLVPGSVTLLQNGVPLDSSRYTIDYAAARIIFHGPLSDSIAVRYRTYPVLFTAERKHKDIGRLREDPEGQRNPFIYDPNKKTDNDLFKFDGLNKSGSISRGVSFGNNQDVVLNSNLNLQLSGHLTENVDLLMAATDDNIPIQPDGNTQQLQDFDKVFIQLNDKYNKLIAGDFVAMRPNSYFMNFNKRAQGLHIELNPVRPVDPHTLVDPQRKSVHRENLLLTGSAAISRGKFSRYIVQGVEGNQGPYRLRGAENELFIVVLSGTEKVFIDGQLMKRGQEYDYVIDYNTAEVTFTAHQMITKDKRIVVEFQYSDRNYSRSLVHGGADYTIDDIGPDSGKLGLHFNFYSEQDNKNQPLQQQLSLDDKKTMAAIGDTLSHAIVPGYDSVAFNNNEVLYKKIDTLVNSTLYTGVFVYSTNSDSAFYRCTFSNVGQGNGNYIQVTSAANGKVFQWVAPVGSVKQGAYEPVILLITPKQKQLFTAGADYALSKRTKLNVEGAFSRNDLNRFSRIDSQDDDGYGVRMNVQHKKEWGDSLPWTLQATADYELASHYFSPVERYRPVEFERDWNLGSPLRKVTADQHIIGAGVSLGRKSRGLIGYNFNTFIEGSAYNGMRHAVNGWYNRAGFTLNSAASYLDSKGSTGATSFLRQKTSIAQRFGKLQVALHEEQEQSLIYRPASDTLQASSFGWFEWGADAGSADTLRNRFNLFYKQRTDLLAQSTALTRATFAENAGMSIDLLKKQNHQFRTTAAVRRLDINNTLLTAQKPDQSLVGRVEYNMRAWKNAITATTFYEAGSGLEQKKEFTYLQVATGQGAYAWTDYNNNGVKELNEFEIAQYTDQAQYVRVFVPTDDYIKVYSNQFSQSIQLRPATAWGSKKGWRKALSYFSNQTAYRVDRKTTQDRNGSALNPFDRQTSDTALVALNSSLRTTVYFNQMGSKFGIDYSRQDIRGKSLLTNGLESRGNVFDEVRARWNITRVFSLQNLFRDGVKSNASGYFSSRDYRIEYYETEPKFTIQPGTSFRISFSYRYAEKNNVQENGGQFAVLNKAGTELRYNVLSKGSLTAEANFIRINYNAPSNTSIAYEMLEGLKTGDNITWKLSWQRTLANNMQLNIGYEGRQSPGIKTIHTGSAQVRAYF